MTSDRDRETHRLATIVMCGGNGVSTEGLHGSSGKGVWWAVAIFGLLLASIVVPTVVNTIAPAHAHSQAAESSER